MRLRPSPSGRLPGAGPQVHRRARVARGAGRPHHTRCRASCAWSATSPASCSSRWSTASAGAGSRSWAAGPRPRWSPGTAASRSTHDVADRSVPRDRGVLAAVEALLVRYRSPVLPELPPLHGGVVGYLGYDVVREVERLPDVPPDDLGLPDAVLSVIGQLAAFDHWRQRVTLIENVMVPDGADDAELDRAYDEAARLDALAADGARPLDEPVVEPPDADDPLPDGAVGDGRRRLPARGRGGQGAHPRRRHLPGRAVAALRPRPRRRAVRRLPGAAPGEPEPVHVLPAPPRGDGRRLVARADGAAARRQGDLPAHRRHPPAGPHRRGGPPPGRRAERAPEGAGRAHHARRPGPQRRGPGRASSAPSRSTS